ncbi:MAG: hypothetical protein U5K69_14595 [Balneolaceae bacterium]|nr:hypothetical protein [Balneolaceae bacterium]
MGKTLFRIQILNNILVSLLFYLLISPTLTYSATLEKDKLLKNTSIISLSASTIQKTAPGEIDFVGTDPVSINGALVALNEGNQDSAIKFDEYYFDIR